MKRCLALMFALLLALSPTALAQRLKVQINDRISVDAELPEFLPQEVSLLKVTVRPYDLDAAHDLLMPGETRRKEHEDGDTTFGEAGSDYMLAAPGRICFQTDYHYKHLLGVLRIEDEMDDFSLYYPQDVEVEGLSRSEALAQAQKAFDLLGIAMPENALAYTVERDSFAKMQEQLKQCDYQASINRRYLEPLDTRHEGYFFSFYPIVEGLPYINVSHAGALVTRQGVEYLETSEVFDIVKKSKPKKILSPEQALKKAAKSLKNVGAHFNFETEEHTYEPVTIERITLCYEYDYEKKVLYPMYRFDYEFEMSQGSGSWRTRTFDNRPHIKSIRIDPYTGKVNHDNDFDG